MRKNINSYTNLSIFLIMLMITCPSRNSFATGISYGEVISSVNLRQAPGLNGKIITGIPSGTLVIVKDQQAGWYRISVSGETYGYEGWIYGKFLKMISVEKKIPDDQEKIIAPEAHETIPDENSIEEPAIYQNIGQADVSKPTGSPANSAPLIYTKEPEQLRKKPVEAAAEIKTEEKKIDEKNNLNSLNTGKVSGKTISLVTEQKKAPLISDGNTYHKAITEWLRLLLKFASIILSCFAVLLSYKALQSAGETREMVMRFKERER